MHAVHTKHITPERPINAELDQVYLQKNGVCNCKAN
jgi:hypothetical protein